jgi:asparagine synthase (glutamine-hydrolysing)
LCGIAGFTHIRNVPARERIVRAVESLTHRGPDQQSVFETNFVSIGATRLKIIDLDGGDQPIFTADRDVAIVFNGEIYNHAELRVELESRGHKFRSRTDTEVVLAAFVEWDTGCFSRLRGMFAIALWTESQKRLLLARDRIGIKPLYIARRGADLYFGSEIKAILMHPEIERRLSMHALDCYLSMNYVPGPWTMVEGIEKLEQGHWLEWREGKERRERYWNLPVSQVRQWTAAAAQEELSGLLESSVHEHLGSDVDLGVWLSGGVDSSAIVHYAARERSRLKTFSVSFRGQSFDESGYIRQVAEHYGTDHQELDLNPDEDLAGAIEEFAQFADEPNADAGALPVWFLSRLTRKTATVALSGEGADELFGGYLTYRADELARSMRRVPAGLLRLGRAAVGLWPVSDEKISWEYKAKRFLDGCLMAASNAHVYWNGTFSVGAKRELLDRAPAGAFQGLMDELSGALSHGDDLLPAYLRFDQKYYLPDDILSKVDRMSMAHSVEVRPPFLDHRIVEFAASLPSHLKIQGDRQKVVLKDLMRDKLPNSILKRKKMGFDIPAHEWLRGPLRPLLEDMVSTAASEYGDLFQQSVLEDCVRQHLSRRANLGYHLWGLTILFLWMRKWRIETPAEAAYPRQMASASASSM